MSVLRHPHRHYAKGVWQFFFCLTIVSFLCRAVIPVGYMPDASGGRDSKVYITLCTEGGGVTTLLMNLDGETGQSAADDHLDHQECPFGIVASQTMMPGDAVAVLAGVVAHRPASLAHRNHALPPLPSLGPPLGSRAPPSNLG